MLQIAYQCPAGPGIGDDALLCFFCAATRRNWSVADRPGHPGLGFAAAPRGEELAAAGEFGVTLEGTSVEEV